METITPEQIKKIAEEYAASVIDPMPIGNHLPEIFTISKESAKKSFTEMYLPFLEFLTEHYCVVERAKVVETYNEINSDARCISEYDDRMLFDYDVYNYFHSLFGSKIFKNK